MAAVLLPSTFYHPDYTVGPGLKPGFTGLSIHSSCQPWLAPDLPPLRLAGSMVRRPPYRRSGIGFCSFEALPRPEGHAF